MGFFDFFRKKDMDSALDECRATPGSVLLDVRTPDEYVGGHIPGSINIPLDQLHMVSEEYPNTETPIYVYCHSGARSSRAAGSLKKAGYTNINDLGGIIAYRGEVESL